MDWVTDGPSASTALTTAQYDLVILDLGLPRMSGLQVLRHCVRAQRSKNRCPCRSPQRWTLVTDRVEGLGTPARMTISSPFALLDELHARVRALIRRRNAATSNMLSHGRHVRHRFASGLGRRRLSCRCVRHPLKCCCCCGQPVDQGEQLMEGPCAWDSDISLNAIEVYVHRLRKSSNPLAFRCEPSAAFWGYSTSPSAQEMRRQRRAARMSLARLLEWLLAPCCRSGWRVWAFHFAIARNTVDTALDDGLSAVARFWSVNGSGG